MNKVKIHSPQEIDLLLNLSISEETNWHLLIATRDKQLVSAVRKLFADDQKVHIENVSLGCDALIACVRDNPDLLIVDDHLADIPAELIIKSLRRHETLQNIKIFCNTTLGKTAKIPDVGADDYIIKYNLEKVYLLRKESILTSDSDDQKRREYLKNERRWPRTRLNIIAKVEMMFPNESEPVDYGKAVVENISFGGLCLSSVQLKKGVIPDENFLIRLTVDHPPLKNWKAESLVVRNKDHEPVGLKFTKITKKDQLKICNLFEE
ncbi:hypothetical protein LLG96_16655 [bacterium]|nr:hypothetical protein [bacterium]